MHKISNHLIVSFLLVGLFTTLNAQNVEFKLGGSKKTNYFVIKNSKDKVLLKVRGNGLLNTKNSMNLDGYNYSYQIQNNNVLRIDKNEGTYVGVDAGKNNISGTGNTFSGYQAGIATTGNYNTFTGSWAGLLTTTGAANAFYGRRAGEFNITGTNNTYIGYGAGRESTGSGNVFLGYDAGYNETTGSNLLYINNSSSAIPLIWGDFSTDDVIINGDLKVTGSIESSGLISIPSEAFQPKNNEDYNNYRGGYILTGSGILVAEVNLPHGAVITDFKVYFYDTLGTGDLTVYLCRHDFTNSDYPILATVVSSGTSGYQNGNDDTITDPTVDNSIHGYVVYAKPPPIGWASNLRIHGAVVTYTTN